MATINNPVLRGEPIKSKSDCNPFDFGICFESEIGNLSDEKKYEWITKVWKPTNKFVFPKSKEGKRANRFNYSWLTMFSWLVYSEYLDGAFCLPCVLFGKQHGGHNSSKLDKLFKSPMVRWSSSYRTLVSHSNGKCLIHNFSVLAMDNFRRRMRQEVVPIDQQLDNLLQQQIAKNRQIMTSLFNTVIFCGKNNIALRGRRDDDPTNDSLKGNFQALLSFRVESGDQVLEDIQ